jgi:hypothetical protein
LPALKKKKKKLLIFAAALLLVSDVYLMTPQLASPPRPIRQKCPAVQLPPNLSSYNRDQSEIASSWWAEKKEKLSILERQVSRSKSRVHALEVQAQVSNEKIEELTVALQAAQCPEVDPNVQKVVNTINNNGGLKKIDSKDGHVIAIRALLTSFLAIIMQNTHPITHLCTVTDVLFKKMIFGAEITGTILQEIYEKYIIPKQRRFFFAQKDSSSDRPYNSWVFKLQWS